MSETIACLIFNDTIGLGIVELIVLVSETNSFESICNFSYDNDKPKDASNDRFILSKGHCAPILYAAHAMSGLFPIEEIQKLRKIDSDLEGTFTDYMFSLFRQTSTILAHDL